MSDARHVYQIDGVCVCVGGWGGGGGGGGGGCWGF